MLQQINYESPPQKEELKVPYSMSIAVFSLVSYARLLSERAAQPQAQDQPRGVGAGRIRQKTCGVQRQKRRSEQTLDALLPRSMYSHAARGARHRRT